MKCASKWLTLIGLKHSTGGRKSQDESQSEFIQLVTKKFLGNIFFFLPGSFPVPGNYLKKKRNTSSVSDQMGLFEHNVMLENPNFLHYPFCPKFKWTDSGLSLRMFSLAAGLSWPLLEQKGRYSVISLSFETRKSWQWHNLHFLKFLFFQFTVFQCGSIFGFDPVTLLLAEAQSFLVFYLGNSDVECCMAQVVRHFSCSETVAAQSIIKEGALC